MFHFLSFYRANKNKAGQEVAALVTTLNAAELVPTAFFVLLHGYLSDRFHTRKFLLYLPYLGNIVFIGGFLLAAESSRVFYRKLFIYISAFLSGLSCNLPGFMAGSAAYVSDTDAEQSRTLRLSIIETTLGISFGISTLMTSYIVKLVGYCAALRILCAMSLIGLIILFFLKESQLPRIVEPKEFNMSTLCSCGTPSQRKLLALFIAYELYILIQQGQEKTYVPYLQNSPFCMNIIQVSYFIAIVFISSAFFCWPGVPIFYKLGVDDDTLAFLAVASKLISTIVLTFSRTPNQAYICEFK